MFCLVLVALLVSNLISNIDINSTSTISRKNWVMTQNTFNSKYESRSYYRRDFFDCSPLPNYILPNPTSTVHSGRSRSQRNFVPRYVIWHNMYKQTKNKLFLGKVITSLFNFNFPAFLHFLFLGSSALESWHFNSATGIGWDPILLK